MEGTLENVFKTAAGTEDVKADDGSLYKADSIYVCKHKVAKPRVFIPVFPGTNCEYDSTRAFERAGAEVDVKVFKNLTAEDIHDSVEIFEKAISQAQMIMFPVDSQQVMSRMDLRNSLQLHSRMRRSKRQL